jgi:effector-binding domain-containing protein
MALEIVDKHFAVNLYGFSGQVLNKNYGGTGRPLMDAMWKEVKSKEIKNKGINYWVYEKGEMLFTGVELEEPIPADSKLELKKISLAKYARWKHIGPYTQLKQAYDAMHAELAKRNIDFYFPFLEIYGHWTPDENKLETEILFALQKTQ